MLVCSLLISGLALILSIKCFAPFSGGFFFLICFFNPAHLAVKNAEDAVDRVTLTIQILVVIGYIWLLAVRTTVEKTTEILKSQPRHVTKQVELHDLSDFLVYLKARAIR